MSFKIRNNLSGVKCINIHGIKISSAEPSIGNTFVYDGNFWSYGSSKTIGPSTFDAMITTEYADLSDDVFIYSDVNTALTNESRSIYIRDGTHTITQQINDASGYVFKIEDNAVLTTNFGGPWAFNNDMDLTIEGPGRFEPVQSQSIQVGRINWINLDASTGTAEIHSRFATIDKCVFGGGITTFGGEFESPTGCAANITNCTFTNQCMLNNLQDARISNNLFEQRVEVKTVSDSTISDNVLKNQLFMGSNINLNMWRTTITGNTINDSINMGRITSCVVSNNSMAGVMDIDDILFSQITNNNFSNIDSLNIVDTIITGNTIRGQIQSSNRVERCVISNNKLFDGSNHGSINVDIVDDTSMIGNSCSNITTGSITNSRFSDNKINNSMIIGDTVDTSFTGNYVADIINSETFDHLRCTWTCNNFNNMIIKNATECVYDGNIIKDNIDCLEDSTRCVYVGNIAKGFGQENANKCVYTSNRLSNSIIINVGVSGCIFNSNICREIKCGDSFKGVSDNLSVISLNSNTISTVPGSGNWPDGATDIIINNVDLFG